MAIFDFEKLTAEALENVSGGTTEFDNNLADLYIGVAKDQGMSFDEMVTYLRQHDVEENFARRGQSFDEFVGVLRQKW